MDNKYRHCVITEINDQHIKLWKDLWEKNPNRHLFNSPEFFLACIDAFGTKKYAVIFLYENDILCGVLPLVAGKIFGINAYTTPGHKGNYIDKFPLLINEYSRQMVANIMNIAKGLGSLCLPELSEMETELFFDEGKMSFIRQASVSRFLRLDSEKDILQFMSSNEKKNLIKRINSIEGRSDFKIVGAQHLDTVIDIEKKSYRSHYMMSFFSNEKSKKFIQSMAKFFPKSFRLGILFLDGKPIATNFGFVYGKVFCGYHMAFDDSFSSIAPGKITFYFMLESLKSEGFSSVDFLRGDSNLKKSFAQEIRVQYDAYATDSFAVRFWWLICSKFYSLLRSAAEKIREFPDKFIYFYKRIKMTSKILSKRIYTNFFDKKSLYPYKKRKKIVIFSNYDDLKNPWYGGGGARSISEVTKGLVKNFEVTVLTGRYPGSRNEKICGISYQRIGAAFLGPKIGQLIFAMLVPFYAFFKKYDGWVESLTPPFGPSLVPLVTKKPIIALVHMLPGEDMWRKYKIPFYLFEKIGLKLYKNFIVLTEEIKETIERYNAKASFAIIPNGVNLPDKKKQDGQHILFISRIEINQKGLDLLIKAFEKVDSKKTLVIAGSGQRDEVDKLRDLIDKSPSRSRIHYVGKIDGPAKEEFFQKASLVVIPSRHETFSLVALEAFSYGIPVVMFDLKNLKWIPENCAIRVTPFDQQQLAQSIDKLESDALLREKMAAEAKNFAARFNWNEINKEYARFINSLLEKNGV